MQNLNIDAELQMQLEKHTVLENLSISLFRKSRDNNTNTNGHRLIQICRNNNIFILNGRVHKDRNLGNFTFRNKSVFDYVLSTAESFQYVINFEISETDSLFSDGHSAVTWALRCNPLPTSVIASSLSSDSTPSLQHYGKLKYKWGNNLKEEFANNLCLNEMNEIYLIFDSTEVDVKDKIDSITHKIKYIFQEAAKNTLPRKRNVVVFFFFFFFSFNNKNNNKSWFGPNCFKARKIYHEAKTAYNSNKNDINKRRLRNASKDYRRTMDFYIKREKHENSKRLRNLSDKNPKKY